MIRRLFLGAIRLYQRILGPLKRDTCRFFPTCSEYAAQAIEFRGPFLGLLLGSWRILRCHPLSRGGFDPVPLPRAK